MKKVFDNSELPHVFARDTQIEGRNSGGSMFFEDGTFYSYGRHFAIAKRVMPGVYLFTTRSYSPTTARHISRVRQALRGSRLVYCTDPSNSVASNVLDLRGDVESAYLRAASVKYPDGRGKGQIARISAEIVGYIEQARALIALQHELSTLTDDKTCAPMDTPAWCAASDNVLLAAQAFAAQKAKDDQARDKAREAARKVELSKARAALKDWVSDNTMQIPAGAYQLPVVCRILGDGILQTSHGARVPVAAIKSARLWALITGKRPADYPDMMIGDYKGVKIDAKGDMSIGCHNFAFAELRRIAAIIGEVA